MSGGSAGGGTPDPSGSGAAGAGSGESLDEVFNKSLGDFDGEMERERSGMASAGQGSGQSVDGREGGDAGTAGAGDIDGPGGMVSIPSSGGVGGVAGGQASTSTGSADGAAGQPDAAAGGADGAPESTEEGRGDENAQAANIPDDIPLEGNAEDQVARQIREAAMAEKDPAIRDALWDEYRKHQGIK